MAFHWWANDGLTLDAGLVTLKYLRGPTASFAKKPYNFVIFQGGQDPLSPLWIQACKTRVTVDILTLCIDASGKDQQ